MKKQNVYLALGVIGFITLIVSGILFFNQNNSNNEVTSANSELYTSEINNIGYTTKEDSTAKFVTVEIQWSINKDKLEDLGGKENAEQKILESVVSAFSESTPFPNSDTNEISKTVKDKITKILTEQSIELKELKINE